MITDTDITKLKKVFATRDELIGVKSDVAELKTDVAGLKVDVAELKTDVAGLKVDVAELKTDVAGLKVDVAELKTDVAGLKVDVAELKTDVAGLKVDVAELKTDSRIIQETLIRMEQKMDDSIEFSHKNFTILEGLAGKVADLDQENKMGAITLRRHDVQIHELAAATGTTLSA